MEHTGSAGEGRVPLRKIVSGSTGVGLLGATVSTVTLGRLQDQNGGVPVLEPSDHPPAGQYSFPCGPKESQSPSYRPVFFRLIQLIYMNAIATGESGRGELGWLLPKPPVIVTYNWPSTTCGSGPSALGSGPPASAS